MKAADVEKFAHEFATAQPSVIRIGVALERSAGGGQTIRAACCLPALVGSWRHVGGGLLQMPLWDFPVDWIKAARPDWIKPGTRAINNLRLGAALTGEMNSIRRSRACSCSAPIRYRRRLRRIKSSKV